MSEEKIRAELRAALYLAIARLGEEEARRIAEECLGKAGNEHYGRSGR